MANSLIPVIEVDPNGPWRQIEGVTCLVTMTSDPDLIEALESGELKPGDFLFAFQPNEHPDGEDGWVVSQDGWGGIEVLHSWKPTTRDGNSAMLIYLDTRDNVEIRKKNGHNTP